MSQYLNRDLHLFLQPCLPSIQPQLHRPLTAPILISSGVKWRIALSTSTFPVPYFISFKTDRRLHGNEAKQLKVI